MKRNEVIQVRVSLEEKDAIEQAAAERHMTTAEYVRSVAVPAVRDGRARA